MICKVDWWPLGGSSGSNRPNREELELAQRTCEVGHGLDPRRGFECRG
jgi:hypothetical protein